ncbi:MAG: MATE family efflux transporter, partial [Eubacteriales bacterium]|nr:MATE family efflux transporter [Eubacteriales bacterium]
MRNEIFEKYPVKKAIFTLSIPTILGMLVTVVYNIADTYFIGRTGDYNQVAAVSLCMPLFFLFMSLGNLFGVGGATYISRLLGAKEDEKVKYVSAFSIYGALITGIICSI